MGRLKADEIERIEARANRGERWLLVAVGFMIAGLVSLAAGAPYVVHVLMLCASLAAAAVSARDLVPVYRGIIRWRRWRKDDEDGDRRHGG
jgi:hypothetical protein